MLILKFNTSPFSNEGFYHNRISPQQVRPKDSLSVLYNISFITCMHANILEPIPISITCEISNHF